MKEIPDINGKHSAIFFVSGRRGYIYLVLVLSECCTLPSISAQRPVRGRCEAALTDVASLTESNTSLVVPITRAQASIGNE